jgi:hypothetical protein
MDLAAERSDHFVDFTRHRTVDTKINPDISRFRGLTERTSQRLTEKIRPIRLPDADQNGDFPFDHFANHRCLKIRTESVDLRRMARFV